MSTALRPSELAWSAASCIISRPRSINGEALSAALSRTVFEVRARPANEMMGEAQGAAAGAADTLRHRAAETSATIADSLKGSMDDASQMAKDTLDVARSTINRGRSTISEVASAASDAVASSPQKARQAIGDNAALIGGLGIAIGALLAASLPKSETEAAVIGPEADEAKRAAGSALQSGFEEVKEAAPTISRGSDNPRASRNTRTAFRKSARKNYGRLLP